MVDGCQNEDEVHGGVGVGTSGSISIIVLTKMFLLIFADGASSIMARLASAVRHRLRVVLGSFSVLSVLIAIDYCFIDVLVLAI